MSVPAWKQAILDRKKKQEDEQKQKEAKEVAYLSSLPPWKRAIVMKQRQSTSPTSTLERDDSSNKFMTNSAPTTPSNKWMTAVQNVRQASPKITARPAWAVSSSTTTTPGESSPKAASRPAQARNQDKSSGVSSPKTTNRPAWARNEVSSSTTRVSSPKTTNRPAWARNETKSHTASSSNKPITKKTPSATSHNFTISKPAPVSSTSTPSTPVARMGRRESVTVLPDSTSSMKPLTAPSIPGVSLRSPTSKNIVHVSDKRRSFEGEGDDDDDAKLAAMPAWKKALIMRRRAAAVQETGKSKPGQSSVSNHTTEEDFQKQTPTDNHSSAANIDNQAHTESTADDETDAPSLPDNVQMSPEDSHPDEHAHVSSAPFLPDNVRMSPEDSRPDEHTHAPVEPSERKRKSRTEKKDVVTKNVPKKEDKQKVKPKSSSSSATSTKKTSTKVRAKKTSLQPTPTTQGKTKPEIVNRQKEESDGPSKLVEQEGVVHRPPIYKEVDEWASVTENDPAFTKLPLWKQALIKRRRNDITKRSGAFISETSSQAPKQQQHSSPGRASTTTQNLPAWKAELLKKKGSNTSITVEERKLMNRAESNGSGSSSQNSNNNNMKNLVGRFNSNTSSKNSSTYVPGKVQPVRQAPARPAPVRSAPAPPMKTKEEEEEPMFTYSFKKSHKTIDAGSESSDSSDSELEDITLTQIDDISSDEDDSGIDKGGIVVTSYKVMNNDYAPPQSPTEVSLVVSKELVKERKDSTSILIDPSTKSHRGLRRVSFSDSQLTVEHFYPKYSYHDYDDISDDDEHSGPRITHSTSVNSGLSHKVHPSLRSTNETDSDVYRYSPSKASPMKPSSSHSSLGSYTPSILGSYNGMLQNHLSGSGYHSTSPVKSPVKILEEPDNASPVIDDRAADFYSHLNTDTAALLW